MSSKSIQTSQLGTLLYQESSLNLCAQLFLRKLFTIIISKFLLFTIFAFCCSSSLAATKQHVITVNQYVNHIALDSAYDGLKKSLSDRGYLPEKIELIYANAQGNISNSVQISRHQASLKPNFMVAIATPSFQTNLKAKASAGEDTISAFLAVTDLSGLNVENQENIIGVTDNPPIYELFEVVKKVFPNLKTVGVIYNAGEINSVKIVDSLQKIAPDFGFEVKTVTISNSSDIKGAISKLSGSVDLLYLPQDNTVISALDNVIALAKKSEIPVIANDPTLVDHGVMLALGTNYFSSGKQLGNIIADMIEGKKPSSMIQNANISELRINDDMTKILNINIPEEVRKDERLAQ